MNNPGLRFAGSDSYVATAELTLAVNAAVTLSRPLLIKGEPGTGKTQLAQEVASALDRPLFEDRMFPLTLAGLDQAMRSLQ